MAILSLYQEVLSLGTSGELSGLSPYPFFSLYTFFNFDIFLSEEILKLLKVDLKYPMFSSFVCQNHHESLWGVEPQWGTPLRLQQVLIKPKEDISSALVAWEGGLLSLVNIKLIIKSAHPP